jgi:hypothetical protein
VHIFTTTPTFHGIFIRNHDLKIVDYMDITHGLLRNEVMNKIMGSTTIDEDEDFCMLEITN